MIDEKKVLEIAHNQGIIRYSSKLLGNYDLPYETQKILEEIGVPKYASPYIDFMDESKGGGTKLNEYYDLSLYEEIEDNELEEIKIYFEKYIVLGNIENDAFVLNENFQIIRVDSETLYEHYVNYTLNDFLESTLAYQRTIEQVRSRYDKNKVIDFEEFITQKDIDFLKNRLLEIDKYSIDEDSFWGYQIELLEENLN